MTRVFVSTLGESTQSFSFPNSEMLAHSRVIAISLSRSINADGFGVGWYDHQDESTQGPCIFRKRLLLSFLDALREFFVDKPFPALLTHRFNHTSLEQSEPTSSGRQDPFFSRLCSRQSLNDRSTQRREYVRPLSPSSWPSLSHLSPILRALGIYRHPWSYGNLIWMHNGCIADFHKIKRRLQNDLSDEMFSVPQGNTDSEWSFACFLDQLAKVSGPVFESSTRSRSTYLLKFRLSQFSQLTDPRAKTIPHAVLRKAMLATVSKLRDYTLECDGASFEPSLMK